MVKVYQFNVQDMCWNLVELDLPCLESSSGFGVIAYEDIASEPPLASGSENFLLKCLDEKGREWSVIVSQVLELQGKTYLVVHIISIAGSVELKLETFKLKPKKAFLTEADAKFQNELVNASPESSETDEDSLESASMNTSEAGEDSPQSLKLDEDEFEDDEVGAYVPEVEKDDAYDFLYGSGKYILPTQDNQVYDKDNTNWQSEEDGSNDEDYEPIAITKTDRENSSKVGDGHSSNEEYVCIVVPKAGDKRQRGGENKADKLIIKRIKKDVEPAKKKLKTDENKTLKPKLINYPKSNDAKESWKKDPKVNHELIAKTLQDVEELLKNNQTEEARNYFNDKVFDKYEHYYIRLIFNMILHKELEMQKRHQTNHVQRHRARAKQLYPRCMHDGEKLHYNQRECDIETLSKYHKEHIQEKGKTPNPSMYAELEKITHMSALRIQMWFKNHAHRQKNKLKKQSKNNGDDA